MFLFFNIFTHRAGVKVKATNPDIRNGHNYSDSKGNCLYISPLNPPINATGLNTAGVLKPK